MTASPDKVAAPLPGFETKTTAVLGPPGLGVDTTTCEIVVQLCDTCNRWTAHSAVQEPGLYINAACRRCGSRSHDRTRKEEPAYYRGNAP